MRERRKPTCSSSAPPSDTGMLPNNCAYVSSKPRRWSSGGGGGRRDGTTGFSWLISLPAAAVLSESGSGGGGRRGGVKGFRWLIISLPSAAVLSVPGRRSDDVGASPSKELPLAAVGLLAAVGGSAAASPLRLPCWDNCRGSRKVMPSLVKALCNTSCASTADGLSERAQAR